MISFFAFDVIVTKFTGLTNVLLVMAQGLMYFA